MEQWQPIETAPRREVYRDGMHHYGEHILGALDYGEVLRLRWWFTEDGASNFIGDCGNAYRPTHWSRYQLPLLNRPWVRVVAAGAFDLKPSES